MQTKEAAASTEPSQVSTARILGKIPDGTAPLPKPPKPGFTVAARDVIKAQTYHEGRRAITFQRIAPPPLANPVESPAATETIQEVPHEEEIGDVALDDATEEFVMARTTVFRPKGGSPRSLVQLWPQVGGEAVAFWFSADLLSAIGSFVGNDGKAHSLMLMWSVSETDSLASLEDEPGSDSPPIPKFAEG